MAKAIAVEKALRSRQRERERLLREDPAAVFEQLAAEARLSLGNAAKFGMTTVHPDMWKALYRLVRDVPNSDSAPLPDLARAVLDRAVVQRAAGVSFLNAGELKEADSVLDRYQELPVLAADSLEEFQRQLDVLRQVREGEDAERRLFVSWRTSFIDRKRGVQSADALAAAQGWQGLQFPLECAQVTVGVSDGSVTYSNVDELLTATRRYSGPNLRADMDELEAAIQGWHEAGSPQTYDDAAHGGGPRGRGGALFYGHDIHLTRAGKDAVKLRFSPGDYGHRGIRMLEGFAAFDNGKTVRYEGPIELTYYIRPPDDITTQPLYRSPDQPTRRGVIGALVLPVPVDQVAFHLQVITECGDQVRLRVINALKSTGPVQSGPKSKIASPRGVTIWAGGSGNKFSYRELDGAPHAVHTLWQSGSRAVFALPAMQVSVQFNDPIRHSQMGGTLLAATQARRSEPHPAGSYDTPATFTFDEAPSAALLAQSPQELPPVALPASPAAGTPPGGRRGARGSSRGKRDRRGK